LQIARRLRRDVNHKFQVFRPRLRADGAADPVHHPVKIEIHGFQRYFARLDFREIQDIVEDI